MSGMQGNRRSRYSILSPIHVVEQLWWRMRKVGLTKVDGIKREGGLILSVQLPTRNDENCGKLEPSHEADQLRTCVNHT